MNAINRISMATYMKIFMKFNSKFWNNTEYIGRADLNRGYYPLFQPLDSLGGKFPAFADSNIMIATLTDPMATTVSNQPESETKEDIMQVLREIYPNENFAYPEQFLVPNWKTNPLYYGSYSNCPVGVNDETYRNLIAPLGRLYFSGEALNKNYTGFVHGAYLEGIATATSILEVNNRSSGFRACAQTIHWQLLLASLVFVSQFYFRI